MRKFAAGLLLAISSVALVVPISAERSTDVDSVQGQTKRQRKAWKKYTKRQQKEEKKAEKRERKRANDSRPDTVAMR